MTRAGDGRRITGSELWSRLVQWRSARRALVEILSRRDSRLLEDAGLTYEDALASLGFWSGLRHALLSRCDCRQAAVAPRREVSAEKITPPRVRQVAVLSRE
jgi:uncharacterized protein YjiS (DUF1127 family)